MLYSTTNIYKDVFRELDGFVLCISVLSSLTPPGNEVSSPVLEPREQVLLDVSEGTRLVFEIIAEAMSNHPANTVYFTASDGSAASS